MLISCVVYQNGQRIGDVPVSEIRQARSRPGCFVWVAIKDPEPKELEALQAEFDLHDLAVEDAQRGHQRPKLEEYGTALFAVLQTETNVASLYISHDLAVVSSVASRVAVIHRGQIVETSEARAVFHAPRHDYTRRLVTAVPRPDRRLAGAAPEAVAAPLLEARGIGVRYGRPSLIADLLGRQAPRLQACCRCSRRGADTSRWRIP